MAAKIYGHRGARSERPENTLEGFMYARSLGVAGIETDIAMTADFVPVLHHDAALGDGRLIKNLAAAELPAEIPTLAMALAAVPEPEWLLEIKTFPDKPEETHPPGIMVEHVLAVLALAPSNKIRILAFDWAVLREVAARAPELPRVCLTAPDMEAERRLWWGAGYAGLSTPAAVAASGAHGWSGLHRTLDPAQIREAHALGLDVFAWTVNDTADFNRLAPMVEGVITDFPSRFAG